MKIPAFNGISMQIYSAFFEHMFEKYKKMLFTYFCTKIMPKLGKILLNRTIVRKKAHTFAYVLAYHLQLSE
jgi:hypothetical protein